MIKSVTVTNPAGDSLKLEMSRPETSGFYIQNIEGLGPSKANINISESATVDGGYYVSSHVNTRNIVITLGFLFEKGIEDMRHESYKYFPLKKKIKLVIETDRRSCVTYGYVESNEPNIFSSRETTQISILCPDPYFHAINDSLGNAETLSGMEPLFEFPFSNDSASEPLIEFGEYLGSVKRRLYNNGDIDIGVVIRVRIKGNVQNFLITNYTTGETMKIDTGRLKTLTGSVLISGDEVIINTKKGSKSVYLFRNGASTNILNCMGNYAEWLTLAPGENEVECTASSGLEYVEVEIDSEIAYSGV